MRQEKNCSNCISSSVPPLHLHCSDSENFCSMWVIHSLLYLCFQGDEPGADLRCIDSQNNITLFTNKFCTIYNFSVIFSPSLADKRDLQAWHSEGNTALHPAFPLYMTLRMSNASIVTNPEGYLKSVQLR